ncbi:hypothetical protein HWV62_6379 [Athelia sp. TMB]|nr:hypothetical protein HWV62_6379 [Athelia sp. TMB]
MGAFDTIKTRQQCGPTPTPSALSVLRSVLRNEGVRGLYKGATPPAVGWSAIDGVLLGSLHNYRLLLAAHAPALLEDTPGREVRRLGLLGHGLAGGAAGLTSAAVATPVELLKVKLQLQTQRAVAARAFAGPVDCARQVWAAQGARGLWTGLSGSLLFRANFFWMFLSFEALMRGFGRLEGTRYEMSTGLANFLSGGLGSFAFWGFAIPADNIKNRMMAQPLAGPRKSLITIARDVYRVDGARGFFRGLGPTFLRAFPANASAFFVYEGTLRLLGAEKAGISGE